MKKAKKKNERRVLILAMVVALLIVAGGTFAWFTSKDEVTNKLSAEQKYNVSITENFTTPSSWIPGQEVNKDVNLINTGNIDAFVKMGLSSSITVTVAAAKDLADFTAEDAISLSPDEVQMLKAGGDVVYAVDALVSATPSTEYTPSATGLYIFERTLADNADNKTYQYAGFYYVKGATADDDKYYALASIEANKDDDGAITGFSAKYASKETKDVENMIHTYDADEDPNKVVASTADGKIKINILLDPNELASWSVVDGEFYYNNTLAPGKSTMQSTTEDTGLVTAVQLDPEVKEDAYVSFEYNLTVKSDSVQVIPSKTGDIDAMSASAGSLGATFVKGSAVAGDADENGNSTSITGFTWTKTTTTP